MTFLPNFEEYILYSKNMYTFITKYMVHFTKAAILNLKKDEIPISKETYEQNLSSSEMQKYS